MLIRLIVYCFAILMASQAPAAEPSARYRLEMDISWSGATHPLDFPASAHMSDLIGATHHSRYALFGDGRTGSSGLESIAENGRTAIARAEMEDAVRRRRIGEIFEADGLRPVPGRMSASFTATEDHSLVSFATMVAPSPDWFTGAGAVSLLVDDAWVDRIELTLWAWDAGTNAGGSYEGEFTDTQPRESVRLLITPHFLGPHGLKPVGKAVLTREK